MHEHTKNAKRRQRNYQNESQKKTRVVSNKFDALAAKHRMSLRSLSKQLVTRTCHSCNWLRSWQGEVVVVRYRRSFTAHTDSNNNHNNHHDGPATPPIALVFDTETTDKVDFTKSFQDPSQPDLVQLGMLLVDTLDWKKRLQISLLIKDAPSISPTAQQVHGITNDDCQAFGVPLTTALKIFENAYQQADCVVAHNFKFDWTVLQTSYFRQDKILNNDAILPQHHQICTMQECTDVLALPGPYKGSFKWPSLEESYHHFTGQSVEDAHDALADAEACMAVFRGLVESEVVVIDKRRREHLIQEEQENDDIQHSLGGYQNNSNHSTKKDQEHDPTKKPAQQQQEEVVAQPGELKVVIVKKPAQQQQEEVVAQPGELKVVIVGEGFQVEGNTYKYRSNLKALGATWNPRGRAWVFRCHSMLPAARKLAGDD